MSNILPAGTPAPEFSLPVTPDQKLSLSELRGRPVILAFYPADWSPVCGDQMALYNEILPEFQKYGAGFWESPSMASGATRRLPKTGIFIFRLRPTLSRRARGAAYGAYRPEDGVTERALFVIDKNGMIAWSYCSPIAINPGAEGILQALEDLAQIGGTMSKLAIAVSADRPCAGRRRSALHPGRIRRLSVPALRTRASDCQSAAEALWQTARVCLSQLSLDGDSSAG